MQEGSKCLAGCRSDALLVLLFLYFAKLKSNVCAVF